MNGLIKISNNEAKKLRKLGVVDGTNGISHTYTHHKNYYLCESRFNLSKLNKIRHGGE